MISILFISLIVASTLASVPDSSAQEDTQIPDWVKNVAGWWANNEIHEKEFLAGIEYMINNNIISLNPVPCFPMVDSQITSDANLVPAWVKNNAGWWAEGLIADADFYNGIQYLVSNQIIKIDNKKIKSEIPIDDVEFSTSWITDKSRLAFVQSSFFELYGTQGDCYTDENGDILWQSFVLGLDPNKFPLYNEVAIWNDPQNTVVIYPYLTYAAYNEPGFYTYYRGDCDTCTTTKFVSPTPLYTSSGMGHQALTLLGYPSVADIQIDKNPSMLYQYDKVILLHSEYVTRAMFDAITNHPNVIYLYPNALYAEVEIDYTDQTMTLIRGHNYPEPEIHNGFDWEFDNTHPYEYDSKCDGMEVYKIKNGWMTNCYPENLFLKKSELLFNLLKFIKNTSGE